MAMPEVVKIVRDMQKAADRVGFYGLHPDDSRLLRDARSRVETAKQQLRLFRLDDVIEAVAAVFVEDGNNTYGNDNPPAADDVEKLKRRQGGAS